MSAIPFLLLLSLFPAALVAQIELPQESLDSASDPKRYLASYAWDDGPPIPWKSSAPLLSDDNANALTLPFGESGLRADALFYLPFQGTSAPPIALGDGPLLVVDAGGAPGEGRFAQGWSLGSAEDRLRIVDPRTEDPGVAWTLDFWIRPSAEASAKEMLATGTGAFELWRDREGRLVLRIEDGEQMRSEQPLLAATWNHVAVVLDGPEIPSSRLVLNGQGLARRRRLEASPTPRALEIGGLGAELDEVRVSARALTTDELAERASPALEPGPHVLHLEFSDGSTRAIAHWEGVIEKARLESDGDWRRAALDHVLVEGGRARWVPGQWRLDRTDLRPQPRTTHATAYIGDHRILVFGGETRDNARNGQFRNTGDTWIYHTVRREWRRVATATAPSPRCHQDAAYSPDHGLVLLPGGWRNDERGEEHYADTWVFHTEEERWERREPSGLTLPAIANSSVVYHAPSKRFLVLDYEQLYAYDPTADVWSTAPLRTVLADSGAFDELATSSRMTGFDALAGIVVIFGGESRRVEQRVFSNATIHYDPRAAAAVLKRPAAAPAPRVRSGFAYDPRRNWFVLYGGVRDARSSRDDDLWTYRADQGLWTKHEFAGGPGPRGGFYDMAYDPELDLFFLLCGRSSFDRFHNDAWRLRLDPSAEGRATWVFDRAAFGALDRLSATTRTPGSSAVAWTFAGSADLGAWSEETDQPDAETPYRYLRVSARLTPGSAGEAPEILELGFERSDEDAERASPPEGAERASWAVPPL